MKSVLWFLFGGIVSYYAMFEWIEYKLVDQAAESAYLKGKQDVLNTSPLPLPELEMACAGLWVGEQNRKAQAREGK